MSDIYTGPADIARAVPQIVAPRVNPPRCICGGVMRLLTVNHSTTTSHGRPGDTESLTTVKWNFACYDCHAHGTIVIDSGDDPMGYTEGS